MKRLLTTAVLVLAGIALSAPPAKALTYTDGDLILGFNASGGTGSTVTYVVDLGSYTQFTLGGVFHTGSLITFDASHTVSVNGGSVSLNGIGADLLANFGDGSTNSSWNTRTDLFFGVAGTQNLTGGAVTRYTDFASKPETTDGTQTTSWPTINLSTASGASSKIGSAGATWAAGSATANVTVGSVQSSSSTGNPNNFAAYQPNANGGANGTQSFNTWNGGIEGVVGTSNNVLDLYQLSPSTAGTYVGSFAVSSNGQLEFSSSAASFQAVPEPGSMALLSAGGIAVAAFLRRRKNKSVTV